MFRKKYELHCTMRKIAKQKKMHMGGVCPTTVNRNYESYEGSESLTQLLRFKKFKNKLFTFLFMGCFSWASHLTPQRRTGAIMSPIFASFIIFVSFAPLAQNRRKDRRQNSKFLNFSCAETERMSEKWCHRMVKPSVGPVSI